MKSILILALLVVAGCSSPTDPPEAPTIGDNCPCWDADSQSWGWVPCDQIGPECVYRLPVLDHKE